MTQQYDNTNRGAIFVNQKEGNDNRPDRKGSINVEGVDYWISGWLKTSASGQPFMSLSVERKQQQSAPAPSKAAPAQVADLTGDIPF